MIDSVMAFGGQVRRGGMLVSISKTMIDIKKRLEEEIRGLDYELKVQLPKEIQRAREYGDLRENAEYKAPRSARRSCRPASASSTAAWPRSRS
jgi:hypothetical protein